MVVYPCDIHKVSRLLTGKTGQLKKEVPSVAMMTNFGFGPFANKKFDDKWRLSQTKYDEWRDKFIPCKLVKNGQHHKLPWTTFKSVRTAKRKQHVAAVKAKKVWTKRPPGIVR